MRRIFYLSAACLFSACVNTTADVHGKSEKDEIADIEIGLTARLEEKFGKGARVQQVFGNGDEVLIGVALEHAPEETDGRPPVAVASYRKTEDALEVVADKPEFREAKRLPGATALVTATGQLKLRRADGAEQTIAEEVKGEVGAAPGDAVIATFEGGTRPKGDSAVFVADAAGKLAVLADSQGVDDRPSVSPDNETVVFVSGRSGIASLWRTTLAGGEAVQITNKGIEAGVERSGPPEGFVPPPVMADRLTWVNADVIRYDAGDGETWSVNIRTGEATQEGGAR